MRGCCTTCQVTVALQLTAVWLSLAQGSLHCLDWTWEACWLGYCWGRTWVLGLKEFWSRSTFRPANSDAALTLAESHWSECGQHLQLSAHVPVYIQAISHFTLSHIHPASIATCKAALAITKWRLSHATEETADAKQISARSEHIKKDFSKYWFTIHVENLFDISIWQFEICRHCNCKVVLLASKARRHAQIT